MLHNALRMTAVVLMTLPALALSEPAASEYVETETLVTESAVPVGRGDMNVEFGMTYHKAGGGKRGMWNNRWSRSRRFDGSHSLRVYEWIFDLTAGIAPDTDLTLSTGWVDMYDRQIGEFEGLSNHGRGMDDLTVSIKRRLIDDRGLSLAYIPGLTVPSGRHAKFKEDRFGPGLNFWTFNQRLAVTKEMNAAVINLDMGYSLPFGRTRRTYRREFGTHTKYQIAEDRKKAAERGILDANAGLVYTGNLLPGQYVNLRPLVELNYAHRWISRGNDYDMLHATAGGILSVKNQMRLKFGYQHPVTGRNAARTRRFLLSLAYGF